MHSFKGISRSSKKKLSRSTEQNGRRPCTGKKRRSCLGIALWLRHDATNALVATHLLAARPLQQHLRRRQGRGKPRMASHGSVAYPTNPYSTIEIRHSAPCKPRVCTEARSYLPAGRPRRAVTLRWISGGLTDQLLTLGDIGVGQSQTAGGTVQPRNKSRISPLTRPTARNQSCSSRRQRNHTQLQAAGAEPGEV
jgi:hypothetical protein